MPKLTDRDEFHGFAALLLAAERTQALYPPGHHRVHDAIRDCHLRLRNLLQRQREIQIALADGEFVVESTQFPLESELLRELAETLRRVGVGKMTFREGIRQWEVQTFLALLASEPEELESRGGMEVALEAEEVVHVEAGPLRIHDLKSDDANLLVSAWEAYSTGIKAIRRLRFEARSEGEVRHLDDARAFVDDLVGVAARETRPLLALHSLKVHDDYSFTHSVNVSMLTLCMARSLGFADKDLREITLAALLHDIGKERVPREILNKPGKLDDDEWEKMRSHSAEGSKMLVEADGIGDLAVVVAYEHQLAYERDHPDYGRWPLHFVSQVVCIADVYDALRSIRPYRGELPPDKALEIMEEEVLEKFEPELFHGFARMVGYYPPGTCVRLDDGACAVAYRPNPDDLRRPRVLLVRDPAGQRIDPPDSADLANGASHRSIVEVIDSSEVGIDPFDYL